MFFVESALFLWSVQSRRRADDSCYVFWHGRYRKTKVWSIWVCKGGPTHTGGSVTPPRTKRVGCGEEGVRWNRRDLDSFPNIDAGFRGEFVKRLLTRTEILKGAPARLVLCGFDVSFAPGVWVARRSPQTNPVGRSFLCVSDTVLRPSETSSRRTSYWTIHPGPRARHTELWPPTGNF